ncbi:MAG: adenylate/guanylate cyclase domain-containing protein [Sideroxydans sp.]|jgi:adenylate cyclase
MPTLHWVTDHKARMLLGQCICLLFALALHFSGTGEKLSHKVLDRQFSLLHRYDARPLENDVVIVGIDVASFRALYEPFELWHPHLGKFLQAMATAKPAVLGLDIALPQRSYQFLIPDYDQPLLQGLKALHMHSPLVLVQMSDDSGAFRPVHQPYLTIAGVEALASVAVCHDADGIVRRFDPNLCTVNTQGSTLVEKMAAHLGKDNPGTGFVDFSAGEPFEYIPFLRVLEWQAREDTAQLVRTFGGKPVLLGVVATFDERVSAPVPLAAWEPSSRLIPAVLMQAQMLRSMLNDGLIRVLNPYILLCLTLLAALFWLGRAGWFKLVALVAFPFLLLPLSTWLLGQGWYLPVGALLFSALFAFLARLLYETALQARQRNWLRGAFGKYVGRDVLQEIVAGNVHSGVEGARIRLCILFAHIHGFSQRSESRPAQEVVALLNDYLSEMTVAIHQHQGVLGQSIGDRVLAFFGAPQALECPEKNALETAQEMLLRLRQVNVRLLEQDIEPIEISLALHVGEVVIGHIGPAARREYTIIGDAVNLTAQLAALSSTLNYPVLCSAAVAKAVENTGSLNDCGEQAVNGNMLHVYGWNPIVLAAR